MIRGPDRQPARVGDSVAAIDTPALVLELDVFERNLRRMAAFAHERGLKLRPHAKCHKSAYIARLQIAAGAVGVCVQKTSEAEVLAEGGVGDIFISNPVVAPHKLERVAALARRVRLAVLVDHPHGVEWLAQALRAADATADVFVEIDVGHGRCGVVPAAAGNLAHRVAHHGLRFAGLQAYHGKAQHLRTPEERRAAIAHAVQAVRSAVQAVSLAGLACPLVTGAGTGTFALEAASGVYGELQPGSYLFMDRDYADNRPDPAQPVFEHALFVKTHVMSARPGQVVVDAGHKSHAVDSGWPRVHGGAWDFVGAADEHGLLRPRADAVPLALGDPVWLIPGHCDPTANLHDHYVGVRGGLANGVVESIWPVDARGCLW